MQVRAAGDAALLIDIDAPHATDQNGNGAAAIAAALRAADLPGIVDVVPGAATVLVSVEPGRRIMADLAAQLADLAAAAESGGRQTHADALTIDVCYDGPDLADVAALTGLTIAEVIERHQAAQYRVGWLGFAPGFGYLTGLDPVLATVPRLASPRQRVPAGSVSIAGGLAAVYPAASPGGWRLLGRTNARLWDSERDPPALLIAGLPVRFRAVDRLPPEAGRRRTWSRTRRRWLKEARGRGAPGYWSQARAPPSRTSAGPASAHLGVPASGAADAASLRLANDLVGNDAVAAGLEVTLGRLVLRFDSAAIVAVAGAPVRIQVTEGGAGGHDVGNRDPASGHQP